MRISVRSFLWFVLLDSMVTVPAKRPVGARLLELQIARSVRATFGQRDSMVYILTRSVNAFGVH